MDPISERAGAALEARGTVSATAEMIAAETARLCLFLTIHHGTSKMIWGSPSVSLLLVLRDPQHAVGVAKICLESKRIGDTVRTRADTLPLTPTRREVSSIGKRLKPSVTW